MTDKPVDKPDVGVPDPVYVPTTIRVTRTVAISADFEDTDRASSGEPDEVIEVHKFATAPAYAEVSVPVKKTKDYHSAGITIGVRRPCYTEELPQAFEEAYALVKERMMVELPKIIRALDDIARA